ncbi:hypothetical protein GCM10010873_09140 [Cypionkella aquatica]|uniref:Uncharacterized protein n=1 Tax=Cypionkella aquatica TaxID=1756042 RepID=A0AA37X0K6_9RHOB|nr:hypothetical protein [Cypionkella aquatica]GLS85940.1 hypothetical protein GCM10010873_09140 [Cypionkella aquatica]
MTASLKYRIDGYDGSELLFSKMIPSGHITEAQLEALLQRLASLHLNYDEIVESSLKLGTAGRKSLLDVQRSGVGQKFTMSVGEGHHFVATIEENHK